MQCATEFQLAYEARTVAMFYGTSRTLVTNLKSVIRLSSVIRSQTGDMSDQFGVTVYSPRMVCNSWERETSESLIRSPYRPWNFLRDYFERFLIYPVLGV